MTPEKIEQIFQEKLFPLGWRYRSAHEDPKNPTFVYPCEKCDQIMELMFLSVDAVEAVTNNDLSFMTDPVKLESAKEWHKC